jgi:hypothetical protein
VPKTITHAKIYAQQIIATQNKTKEKIGDEHGTTHTHKI